MPSTAARAVDAPPVSRGSIAHGPTPRPCRPRCRPATAGPGRRRRCGGRASARPARRRAAGRPRAHSWSTTARVASTRPGSASSSTISTLVSARSKTGPTRSGRRGGARPGWPRGEDPPAGVQAFGEGGEAERPPSLAGGDGVDPEACLGDDPEGALAAHEQLGQVGPGGRPRRRARRSGPPCRRPAPPRGR